MPTTQNPGLIIPKLIINKLFLQSHIPNNLIFKLLPSNSSCKIVSNYIHTLLPLNNSKQLAMNIIINHIIKNKEKMQFDFHKQLFVYIKGKDRVGKNRVIKAIEIDSNFLGRQKKLIILAQNEDVAGEIRGNIIQII